MRALNAYPRFIGLVALLTTALAVTAQAQDEPQFAQYQFSRSLFNPAANGIEDGFSGLLMHRSQWVGFDNAPHAQGLSLQGGLKSINSGIGLNVTNTNYGVTNALSIGIAYAYHLPLGKKYRLSFGIQGDLKVNSDNGSQLSTTGSGDSEFQQDVTLYTGNFGAGLMFHSERLVRWCVHHAFPRQPCRLCREGQLQQWVRCGEDPLLCHCRLCFPAEPEHQPDAFCHVAQLGRSAADGRFQS
jgi:type IX secretion system PorP/SprF family membrane protein